MLFDLRMLLLVPTKHLATSHQQLFSKMGGNCETLVITGDTQFDNRNWQDPDIRIIFATGSVVEKELEREELFLGWFDLLATDETHHSSTTSQSFSRIKTIASKLALSSPLAQLSLTATLGNSLEQMRSVQKHSRISKVRLVDFPVPDKLRETVVIDDDKSTFDPQYLRIEELIVMQLNLNLRKMSEVSQQLPLGKKLDIDPLKFFKRRELHLLRQEIHGLEKFIIVGRDQEKLLYHLYSLMEEYAFWGRFYELFTSESFLAMKQYYQKLLAKNTRYARRIEKARVAEKILSLTTGLVHPAFLQLGKIALWLQRTTQTGVCFCHNSGTAKDAYDYLESLGVRADGLWGSPGMNPDVKDAVISKLNDKQITIMLTTDISREGYNFKANAVLHLRPSTYTIQLRQRDGRAGRMGSKGLAFYLTCKHEQYLIPAMLRRSNLLESMDYRKGLLSPSTSKVSAPEQLSLF
jgi:ERCC4-related helicase